MWKTLLNLFTSDGKFTITRASTPDPLLVQEPIPELVINYDFDGSLPYRSRKSPPTVIVVHHTVTNTPSATRSALKSRNLSTHFEIDQMGVCYRYLDPRTRVASHVGSYNSQSIGIDLTHMTGRAFPEIQMRVLSQLVCRLSKQFEIVLVAAPLDKLYYKTKEPLPVKEFGIYRHSNLASTRCPDGAPIEEYLKNEVCS